MAVFLIWGFTPKPSPLPPAKTDVPLDVVEEPEDFLTNPEPEAKPQTSGGEESGTGIVTTADITDGESTGPDLSQTGTDITTAAELQTQKPEPQETLPHSPLPDPVKVSIPAFDNALPRSEPVDAAYFTDAVFIGDSRTVGFCNYTGISRYCYARVSMNIKSVLTTAFIEDTSGEAPVTRTVLDTIKTYPNAFGKVYISFGTNEYAWQSNIFISCYEYFIKSLKEILPGEVPIYVQSLLPVDEKLARSYKYKITNEAVASFNILLAEMAKRMEVYFVDAAAAVTRAEEFALIENAAGDGVHLNKSGCLLVKDYLMTHTYQPKPPETGDSENSIETTETVKTTEASNGK